MLDECTTHAPGLGAWWCHERLPGGDARTLGFGERNEHNARLMDERADEELMAKYVAGDQDAFRELYDRYAGPLTGAVRRRVSNPDVANDIVQEAFVRFHRARFDFREGARVRPWLYTIAFNLARDWGRKHGRRVQVEWNERDHPTESVDYVVRQEDVERVRAALDQLDEKHREVIDLHWFEGLSFPEISEVTGDGVSALKVRAHRTYKKLRAILGAIVIFGGL